MLVTVLLLLGFAVPVVMAVACVVIARHMYPRGQWCRSCCSRARR
jgi:hypothetical protein